MSDRTAWCQVDAIPSLSPHQWLLGSWALALGVGVLLQAAGRRRGRTGWESAGFALMTVPVWMVLLDVLPDMVKTFCAEGNVVAILPGAPPSPPPSERFSLQAIDAILRNLGYVALGALSVAVGRAPGWWRRPRIKGIAQGLAGLVPTGPGEAASLRWGTALFPLLALANVALAALTGLALQSADKSPYYTNMTAYHAVLLALAAGFGEELVFRGVMQQGTLRLLRARTRFPPVAAAAVAIGVQAIPFAYSHAGYGNAKLLLFAFLFAAFSGAVAQLLGLWAAIALHALIDFYTFYLGVPAPGSLFNGVVALVSAGVLAVAAWEARSGLRWLRSRARPT